MSFRYVWMFCALAACGGSVLQDPPIDPAMIPDASSDAPIDAPADAGSLVIGLPCSADADCNGGELHCQMTAPGGYCSLFCSADAECPTGSVCSPIPFSRISGICMKSCVATNECRAGYSCAVVSVFPGQPNSPMSSSNVCWEPQDAGP